MEINQWTGSTNFPRSIINSSSNFSVEMSKISTLVTQTFKNSILKIQDPCRLTHLIFIWIPLEFSWLPNKLESSKKSSAKATTFFTWILFKMWETTSLPNEKPSLIMPFWNWRMEETWFQSVNCFRLMMPRTIHMSERCSKLLKKCMKIFSKPSYLVLQIEKTSMKSNLLNTSWTLTHVYHCRGKNSSLISY